MSDTSVAPRVESPGLLPRLLGRDAVLIYVLVAVLVIASIALPRFASPITVGYLLLDAIPILLLALPMTLIIITGEIDLSVASIVGLTTSVVGTMVMNGSDFAAAAAVGILVGVIGGAVNGALVAFVGLPSLAVTIGTLALYRGLALVVIGDNAVGDFPAELTTFVSSKLGTTGIPTAMILVALIVVAFIVLLHFTPFGRGLYALGYSTEAAVFVGVRVARAKFWLYTASGLVAGLVGIYWCLRYSSARSDSASGLELTVIAAVLLGGISIFGGRGTIVGALTGVLLISSVNYALRLNRVPDVVLIIITGSLLIVSVVGPRIWAGVSARRYSRRARAQPPSG